MEEELLRAKRCQHVGCGGAPAFACACGAVFYCCRAHQEADRWQHPGPVCARIMHHTARAEVLRALPFSWAVAATAQVDLGGGTACSLLAGFGVHRLPLWARVCRCQDSLDRRGEPQPPWGKLGPQLPAGEQPLPDSAVLCGLPRREVPCLQAQVFGVSAVVDWASYYTARGLPPTSPAGLLMHLPLTLLHALRVTGALSGAEGPQGGKLVIHLLGAQRELDEWPALLELACLLPSRHTLLALVGDRVPAELDDRTACFTSPQRAACGDPACSCAVARASCLEEQERSHLAGVTEDASSEAEHLAEGLDGGSGSRGRGRGRGSLRLLIRRGIYADVWESLVAEEGPPALVFAPNAGIAAYGSWAPERATFAVVGAPVVVTDFCEEAAHQALCALDAPGPAPERHKGVSKRERMTQKARLEAERAERSRRRVSVNPFREPLSCQQDDNALPSYSNGFLFVAAQPGSA